MMMKPKFDAVLEMCIDNGLRLGYNRAFKHVDIPTEEQIFSKQRDAIFEEIYEWFEMEHNDVN